MPGLWRENCTAVNDLPSETPTGGSELGVGYGYSIQLGLWGRVSHLGRPHSTIRGQTIAMSGGSVSFLADGCLPLHSHVDLHIDWPVRSGKNEHLELHILGEVVQCADGLAICRTLRYEFQLARTDSEGEFD